MKIDLKWVSVMERKRCRLNRKYFILMESRKLETNSLKIGTTTCKNKVPNYLLCDNFVNGYSKIAFNFSLTFIHLYGAKCEDVCTERWRESCISSTCVTWIGCCFQASVFLNSLLDVVDITWGEEVLMSLNGTFTNEEPHATKGFIYFIFEKTVQLAIINNL